MRRGAHAFSKIDWHYNTNETHFWNAPLPGLWCLESALFAIFVTTGAARDGNFQRNASRLSIFSLLIDFAREWTFVKNCSFHEILGFFSFLRRKKIMVWAAAQIKSRAICNSLGVRRPIFTAIIKMIFKYHSFEISKFVSWNKLVQCFEFVESSSGRKKNSSSSSSRTGLIVTNRRQVVLSCLRLPRQRNLLLSSYRL